MIKFKEIYLVDIETTYTDRRTIQFDTEFGAEHAVTSFIELFHPEEIELLQVRKIYEKYDERDD